MFMHVCMCRNDSRYVVLYMKIADQQAHVQHITSSFHTFRLTVCSRKSCFLFCINPVYLVFCLAAERIQVRHFFQDSALTEKPVVREFILCLVWNAINIYLSACRHSPYLCSLNNIPSPAKALLHRHCSDQL